MAVLRYSQDLHIACGLVKKKDRCCCLKRGRAKIKKYVTSYDIMFVIYMYVEQAASSQNATPVHLN